MNDPATLSDEKLIARFARRSDPAALGELARRHERSLLGLACGVLGGRQDLAVDAIQETWIRVIRFAPTFHGRSSFKTWLYRIAINQCRNVRKAQMQQHASSNGLQSTDSSEMVSQIVSPNESSQCSDTAQYLLSAVSDLTEDKRMILLLCYHRGMTHEIAADVLEIPLGTLKSRLHAALNELRARLAVEVET